ncbi:XdhC family protein [Deinococcus sp. JMULE3]|uniref:XdhC family protein n=1 Tax=Deinococcus sp. JMULE3 TaxID=2518341 RepID=UPI0015753075|nr:XdhC family protein [Deinococcus sp. JMULE3]NTY00258.1 YHS domain-containing protein [Deinococcus sp. JMULE3]
MTSDPQRPTGDTEFIPDLPERLAQLSREGAAVVVATVVSRRAPVSAQVGDKALIHADGRMEGFVGGACSREIVRRQALLALQGGQARLVRIVPGAVPDAEHAFAERVTVPMNCASEGQSEVFLEPLLPPRLLVVVGRTPVARAIAAHAGLMGDRVWRVLDDDEVPDEPDAVPLGALTARLSALPAAQRARVRSVVASQGHYDETALEALLRAQPNPVGLLASARRAATVRETLAMLSGFTDADLDRIRAPAGLHLGARTPHEVALSVLAELVQLDRQATGPTRPVPAAEQAPAAPVPTPADPSPMPSALLAQVMDLPALTVLNAEPTDAGSAVDPVCGMTVTLPARHTADHAGVTYAFCCPHCKARFLKDPARYLTPS